MTRALDRALLRATETEIDPMTGHGPEWGKAAPVALLIIVLLGIALYFLIKSMNKQMKKVPASFDTETPPAPEAAEAAAEEQPSDVVEEEADEPTRGQRPTARSARGRGHRPS